MTDERRNLIIESIVSTVSTVSTVSNKDLSLTSKDTRLRGHEI